MMMRPKRLFMLDVFRGLAVIAMACYHFGFDLNSAGYIHQDLNNSVAWLTARSLILTTFLLISGISLSIAKARSDSPSIMRILRIGLCATLVSAGSYFMFPDAWIFFGVLHFIVIASLVGRHIDWHPMTLLLVGFVALGLGIFYQSTFFNQPLLQWIGFMTFKPVTEDYVPIFPWIGVFLMGIYLGTRFILSGALVQGDRLSEGKVLAVPAWLGRHSLLIYMIHQPILLGLLWLFGASI
jgi:uncharacterized membrane protein